MNLNLNDFKEYCFYKQHEYYNNIISRMQTHVQFLYKNKKNETNPRKINK